MPKLQHDEERYRPVCSCQLISGADHFLGDCYTAFNRGFGAIGHDQLRQRCDTRPFLRRQPHKAWAKMRPILVEVATEEIRHEQRHYGHWLLKIGQCRLQPQIRLVVTVAVNCEIRSLYTHHRTDLGRYALIVSEPLTEHYRLTGKQNCRSLRIHRLVHTSDAISCGVDGIVNRAPADCLASRSPIYPSPAKSSVELAAGFVG